MYDKTPVRESARPMMPRILLSLLFGLLLAVGPTAVRAQDSTETASDSTEAWHEWAWTPIVSRGGVQISYLFYREADNVNDGVVLRLRNTNDVPVRYSFTVLFRGPEGAAQGQADGRLAPGEVKTGEEDGLFWIPFRDGNAVGRVGLRGIRIQREDPSHSRSQKDIKAPWRTEILPLRAKLSSLFLRTEHPLSEIGGTSSPFVG